MPKNNLISQFFILNFAILTNFALEKIGQCETIHLAHATWSPNPEVLGFTRATAHTKGSERMKPYVLSDTSQQHANFVSILSNERRHLVWPLNHVLGGSWILS